MPLEERIAAADALGPGRRPADRFRRDDYWVTIPAGKFRMGRRRKIRRSRTTTRKRTTSENGRVHEVYLDAYRIARYPVTVGQFQRFVEDEGYEDQRWWTAGGFGQFAQPDEWEEQLQYPSRPVVEVSWFEAAAFCRLGRLPLADRGRMGAGGTGHGRAEVSVGQRATSTSHGRTSQD